MSLRSILRVALVAVFALSLVQGSQAQATTAKGIATLRVASTPSPADRHAALRKAKLNALERWYAESNSAQYQNWQKARPNIENSLDDYFLSTSVLVEETDASIQEYRLVIRAELNTARLSNALRDVSAVASGSMGDRSMLTFVFVAREQAAIKSFDARVHQRRDTKSTSSVGKDRSHTGTEGEAISRRVISTSEREESSLATSEINSDSVTTGGSSTRKADSVSWRVANSAEVNSVVTGIFTNGGFDVVEAEYLELETEGLLNLESIRADYSSADNMSAQTLRNTVKGVKMVGGRYLAIGTLDAGMPDRDPGTGLMRVYVTVLAKTLDVGGRFPRTVSAVGPAQHAGIGPTEMVARTNALRAAAEAAAQQLMQEMNARGVQ